MNSAASLGEVLIVEDSPASLKLLSDLLTQAGYAVRQAPDGELALWSAQARPPELILLDVRMPGIDGFEVCRRLKQCATLRAIPVIFLSAQSDADDKLRGFQAGAVDFIGKPYHAQEVLARTAAHMALARSQCELAAANAELTRTLAELQATREDLQRVERLAALGAMVAGIAHELNTPIGNCVMAASALDARAATLALAAESGLRRSELASFLNDAQQASALLLRNLTASAQLIDSFKQVATDQAGSVRRRFDLAEVLGEMAAAMAPRLRSANVGLQLAVPAGIAMASFPGALVQVIEQLVFNAVIHGLAHADAALVRITAASDNEQLTMSVSDNGKGIASADLARVFEPFFTTRLGQGSNGLGLHIVHNLVANVLCGAIDAISVPGQTMFTVRCPCNAPALARRRPGPTRASPDPATP